MEIKHTKNFHRSLGMKESYCQKSDIEVFASWRNATCIECLNNLVKVEKNSKFLRKSSANKAYELVKQKLYRHDFETLIEK